MNDDLISRKAAIDALDHMDYMPGEWAVKGLTMCKEIIKGLPSAQPETHDKRTKTHSCDCISRQAAMEEISKQQTYKMFEVEDTLYLDANDVGSVLASLPSVQPDMSEYSDKLWKKAYERGKAEAQQRWIPCSERLPEENGQYLITVKYVHVDGYDDIYAEHGEWTDGKWDMFCFGHCGKVENIIAWMPLPEPYQGN